MVYSKQIETLKWVYEECEKSTSDVDDAPGIASEYNRVLEELQEAHPDNEAIQDLDVVSTAEGPRGLKVNPGTISKMKSSSRRILREFNRDLPSVESSDTPNTVIQNNHQFDVDASNEVNIEIDIVFDQLIEQAESTEAEELLKEFKDEMNSAEPDTNRLRNLYKRILMGMGENVATRAGASALWKGIDLISQS